MMERGSRLPVVGRDVPTTRAGGRLIADLESGSWTDPGLQRAVVAQVRAGILLAEREARNGR